MSYEHRIMCEQLRHKLSTVDREAQRLSEQLGSCDRERREWIKRAEKAEAEIARRDAAAGEPLLRDVFESWYQTYMGTPASVLITLRTANGYHETEGDRLNISWAAYQRAALQPAVLPPELSFNEALQLMHEYMLVGDANSFLMGAKWMRAQALALGVQQQKPVVLPEPERQREPGIVVGIYESFVVYKALDAANVKWEVKK